MYMIIFSKITNEHFADHEVQVSFEQNELVWLYFGGNNTDGWARASPRPCERREPRHT